MFKFILTFLTFVSMSAHSKNSGPETEAFYVVPTTAELVDHSRFVIKITSAYEGPETKTISYIFPEILTGEKNKEINFSRVQGTVNSWEAPEAFAFCTTTTDMFSCNIHLKKHQGQALLDTTGLVNEVLKTPFLNSQNAINNLSHIPLSSFDLKSYAQVIDSFYSNEPAGILFYEF